MRHAVADLRGAELSFEGLDDGGAVVTITKGETVNIRFAIPPADVGALSEALHRIQRAGWEKPKPAPETREYRTKPLTVRAIQDFNPRRGLRGTPGFDVLYPDGRAEWMVGHVFEQLFEAGGRYWTER